MTPEDVIRRKRRVLTPPFAGGVHPLERSSFEPNGTLPMPIEDPRRARSDATLPMPVEDPRDPRPNPALTRSRTVAPPDAIAEPEAGRPRAVTFDPQTGRPNEDFYRERQNLGGLNDAYRNWEPRGAKRGFKNSLKAGLMMMGEAVRANPNDPVTAAIAGFGAGLGGATAAPNFTNRLRRKQKLEGLSGELKNQLDLQKTQSQIDQAEMVEVELDNGQKVLVPQKSAATLQSRQQEIGLRGNTLEARKKRWDQLADHEVAGDAQRLYNSGAADDSAELRAEIAKRLRLPAGTVLPPRGLGNQIKLDEFGNYIVVSPRSGAVSPTATPSGKPAQSYETTKEANRDTRQRRAITAQDARTKFVQGQQNRRAALRGTNTGGVKLSAGERQEIARGIGAVERVKRELTAIDNEIKAAQGDNTKLTRLGKIRQQKVDEGATIATTLNELDPNNETGSGEGGYPYRKPRATQASDLDQPIAPNPTGQYSGKRIKRANVAEFGRRHGMTPEEAEAFLKKEQAIIY